MKIRISAVAILSVLFLAALLLNTDGLFNRFGIEKTGAQTLETKSVPEPLKIEESASSRKARRTVRSFDEFNTAVKDKKKDWSITTSKNNGFGRGYVTWVNKNKKVHMTIMDYETLEEAVSDYTHLKDPLTTSTGADKLPQEGFGDESFLTTGDYEGKGKMMNLTFRSGNQIVMVTGTEVDIRSFAKVMSDTVKEKK